MVATVQRNIKNVMRTGATRLFGVDGLGQAAFREVSEFAPASALALKAPLISPEFDGEPLAPTAPLGTNTNQIATMAALKAAVDASPGGGGSGDVTGPASATVGHLAVFDATSGKVIADGAAAIADVISALAKAGLLTVTSPTNLDDLRTKVAGLDSAIVLIGTFAPSGGVLPGAGAAQRGNCWIATDTGTISGTLINAGDRITAIIDNASTSTFAGNWFLEDYTDQVLSVNGQTGAVTIEAIINAATAKGTPVDADVFPILDSAASFGLRKWTWANLKAAAKAYFDTLYGALGTANTWVKPQSSGIYALPSASTITIDGSVITGNVMSLTLGHNALFANPVNMAGASFSIFGQQNGTGGFNPTFDTNWFFLGGASPPAIPSAPNAKFHIFGEVGPSGRVDYTVMSAGV